MEPARLGLVILLLGAPDAGRRVPLAACCQCMELTSHWRTSRQCHPPDPALVPAWSADAIWYQLLVSRFCNGEPANDPPDAAPWTSDWAHLLPGEEPPLRDRLLSRRYGGDLQGLQSKLPYLRDLGVNTLCLSPIFRAGSDHKYDTADHRHVDVSYGARGVLRDIATETLDPGTWQWSDSDRIFLAFLAEAHRQGFRVVLDGVFNHVGRGFWAWQDVAARGRDSRYADWFDVIDWGPPLRWQAWDGPNGQLPNFRKVGDGLHPEVETYLLAVVRRWMDPDGDGDSSDGVDGWRLDAPEQVPLGFWRRLRRAVKQLNPDAILVGEIWGDADDWLAGDAFDAVTNYRFSSPVMAFFAQDGTSRRATDLFDTLDSLRRRHPWPMSLAMMNLLGTHDTERAVTMLLDPQRRRDVSGLIPRRDTLVPDDDAYQRLKLAAVFQFTYPGAPVIFYGDEVGIFGGNDPFCRGPMWWNDRRPPEWRQDLLDIYHWLIAFRQERAELSHGGFRLILADDSRRLLAYARFLGRAETVTLINADTYEHTAVLCLGWSDGRVLEVAKPGRFSPRSARASRDGLVSVVCPPLDSVILTWGPEESPLSTRGDAQ